MIIFTTAIQFATWKIIIMMYDMDNLEKILKQRAFIISKMPLATADLVFHTMSQVGLVCIAFGVLLFLLSYSPFECPSSS